MVFAQDLGGFQPAPSTSPFNSHSATGPSSSNSADSGFSNQLTEFDSTSSDFSNSGRIEEVHDPNMGYMEDQYSYYSSAAKDNFGGYGGSSGGYGMTGYSAGGGGGYQDSQQGGYGGGGGGGGYPSHHDDGYGTNAPTRAPYGGLLKAGVLLLPILIILGLGLLFPQVITVPARRRRDVDDNSYTANPSMLMDKEMVEFATKMLVKASEEDMCLKYVACKLGERAESFPLRARVLR